MTEQQFDVFLCHNSEDKPAVIEIAQQLRQNSLQPWLDVWELQPGAIWQFVLEQQIESIGAAAVFVGQQGLGPWQSEEIYAFLQEFIRRKCPVIPVMLHDAPKQPRLPIFLKNRHWVDFRLQKPDPLVQLIWGITGQKPNEGIDTSEVVSVQEPTTVQPPDVSDELSALRRELEALRAHQQFPKLQPILSPALEDVLSSRNGEDILSSGSGENILSLEDGIDYRNLQKLLEAGQWKKANEETEKVMLQAIGREKWWEVSKDDLLNFSCKDLKTIDKLWVKYSKGLFGFSVQKQIYVECGATLDGNYPGDGILYEFCDRTGWRVKGEFIYYFDVTFSTSAPRGHLPWVWIMRGGFKKHDWVRIELWSLFSRIQICEV